MKKLVICVCFKTFSMKEGNVEKQILLVCLVRHLVPTLQPKLGEDRTFWTWFATMDMTMPVHTRQLI